MDYFNEIESRNELADFLRIPRSKLTHILYIRKPDSYYKVFEIPKKNGGTRSIAAPLGDLKSLQTKLSIALWEHQMFVRNSKQINSNISHAFEKKKGIISNAKIHRNKRFVLNLDLENFFPSIHFGRVVGFFEKNKDFLLPHEVAIVLAQITCFNGQLPQGAPSSPIISNLICQILDMRILRIAKQYKLDFTRYADDLTFSTNWAGFLDIQEEFISELTKIIIRSGFKINPNKTRLLFRDSKQEVTGIVVNKKLSVNRTYVKKTKAMAHSLYSAGAFTIDGEEGTINQLEGRFSFIDQLDHYNNKLDGERHTAFNLCSREKNYRAFIFFKYFFANERPLIIVEGTTDINYLKAALKALHHNYPNLVEKDTEGNFHFKVSFFRRSKRWNYFFNISKDGADAMRLLYHFFTGINNYPNLFDHFQNKFGCVQKQPVMFLFDNETNSKRPLKSFIAENKISDTDQKALQTMCNIRLKPKSKLFLLTNPLVDSKPECAIEDLFTSADLGIQLGGKSFCCSDKFDNKKYFGKNIFSEYVLANYNSINFSRFIPLLDAINCIVTNN